jgi:hypothetical protein
MENKERNREMSVGNFADVGCEICTKEGMQCLLPALSSRRIAALFAASSHRDTFFSKRIFFV